MKIYVPLDKSMTDAEVVKAVRQAAAFHKLRKHFAKHSGPNAHPVGSDQDVHGNRAGAKGTRPKAQSVESGGSKVSSAGIKKPGASKPKAKPKVKAKPRPKTTKPKSAAAKNPKPSAPKKAITLEEAEQEWRDAFREWQETASNLDSHKSLWDVQEEKRLAFMEHPDFIAAEEAKAQQIEDYLTELDDLSSGSDQWSHVGDLEFSFNDIIGNGTEIEHHINASDAYIRQLEDGSWEWDVYVETNSGSEWKLGGKATSMADAVDGFFDHQDTIVGEFKMLNVLPPEAWMIQDEVMSFVNVRATELGDSVWVVDESDPALEDYTGSQHRNVNAFLRGESSSAPGEARWMVDSINAMFDKVVLSDSSSVVYRGMDIEDFDYSIPSVGTVFEQKGFFSSSLDPNEAVKFMDYVDGVFLRVTVPGSVPGLYLEEISKNPGEEEVLFPSGLQFRVTNVEAMNHGNFFVDVEVLND